MGESMGRRKKLLLAVLEGSYVCREQSMHSFNKLESGSGSYVRMCKSMERVTTIEISAEEVLEIRCL